MSDTVSDSLECGCRVEIETPFIGDPVMHVYPCSPAHSTSLEAAAEKLAESTGMEYTGPGDVDALSETARFAPPNYDGPRARAEVLASAPRGFPRPVHPSGLPTPWIANQDDLSDANAFRRAVCVADRLCQVCGLELGPSAVVCWRKGDKVVIDGAGIHPERCWPLARAQCPELVRLITAGVLESAQVPTDTLVDTILDASMRHDGMPVGYLVPR